MNLFTWLTEAEFKLYSSVEDTALDELFQEVRTKVSDRYYISTRRIVKKNWFKTIEKFQYTVFVRVSNIDVGYLNIPNTKEGIMTYFYGLLSGIEIEKKKHISQFKSEQP